MFVVEFEDARTEDFLKEPEQNPSPSKKKDFPNLYFLAFDGIYFLGESAIVGRSDEVDIIIWYGSWWT